jgi:hypothetical protein
MTTVMFDVGGTIFKTTHDTINRSLTLPLAENNILALMVQNFKIDEVIFFDREPEAFRAILNYFRNGKLISPPNLPVEIFNLELQYFGIEIPTNFTPAEKEYIETILEMIKPSENFYFINETMIPYIECRCLNYPVSKLSKRDLISKSKHNSCDETHNNSLKIIAFQKIIESKDVQKEILSRLTVPAEFVTMKMKEFDTSIVHQLKSDPIRICSEFDVLTLKFL